jgi:SAM-dependent methyltransferase
MSPVPPTSLVVPSLDRAIVKRWRSSWDDVMAGFLPASASCETALTAVAEAVCGGHPARVLDLGGGPGVFAQRMAERWPTSQVGVVDIDPVLLALTAAGTEGLVDIHHADLEGSWPEHVAGAGFYDVLTSIMTVHYLTEDQVLAFYRAARSLLRPGGLLAVADLMPETGLPGVMSRLHPAAGEAAAGMAWTQWWAELRAHERLQPLIREREAIFNRRVPTEFTPPVQWHQDAARRAGFTEAGVVWRWGAHAALVAVA